MEKLKIFFARIHSGSFNRMFMYIKQIKQESNQNQVKTFFDMLWCIFRYNVGYLEYRVFGFCYIKGKQNRSSFITMHDNLVLVKKLNDSSYDHILKDKLEFNTRFQKYIGREFLDLRKTDADGLRAFLKKHPVVFAKVTDEFGGLGIARIESKTVTDYASAYSTLTANKQYAVEEAIIQHERMSALNPTSINTIRLVTVTKDGTAHYMYSLVRVGNGTTFVDNISSGGMYAPVNEKGVIFRRAFCDKTGELYERHPVTKTEFVGFTIPYFAEAVALCKTTALQIPQLGYIGWDIVITPNGPALVEGNEMPGYDMCQNYYHLPDQHTGIKTKFQQVLGNSFFER